MVSTAFLAALLGLTMLASVLTGAVVYRKNLGKVLTLRTPLRWHNWVGAGLRHAPLRGCLEPAAQCPDLLQSLLDEYLRLRPGGLAGPAPASPNQLMSRSVDGLLATVRAAYPALVPTRIRLPTQPGAAPFQPDGVVPGHEVPWAAGAAVEVDPTTRKVRAVRQAWVAPWPKH